MSNFSLDLIFKTGETIANSLTEEWSDLWLGVLSLSITGLGLYSAMCWIGTLLAVASLIFLMTSLFKDLNEGKLGSFEKLIWPLLVALLLSNNGRLLAEVTLSIRAIINQINDRVLLVTLLGMDLNQLYREANALISLESFMSTFLRPCQSFIGEASYQCINQAVNQSQELVTSYQNSFGNSNSAIQGISSELTNITNILKSNNQDDLTSIFSFLKPLWIPTAAGALFWTQVAFKQTVELSLLIVGLLGPIAIGASLLPSGSRLLMAWITAFFSIGFARLLFNLMVGLTSFIVISSSDGDPLWYALFSGVFAPILSTTLATMFFSSIGSGLGKMVMPLGLNFNR